ncbi:hypothetical protein apy_09750 [Aeropyrum pernix]|uniref:ArnR1-like winged helix-turn-helix domain-containing protein n=1 Tax=Aeropyrum pernix TaxID=56636 RepID=A0A401HA49_AERPX|nr:winged helix-turn-helix domain-containing protein [Aeropyrum pernix]GBF09250.1 hypothetical protein apy_09750 [Aeropyrum pernix]
MARRSRVEIIIDVLEALQAEGPMTPTRLATVANMPYDRLQTVLEPLVAKGLVRVRDMGRSKQVEITREGVRALHDLKRVRRLLSDLGFA